MSDDDKSDESGQSAADEAAESGFESSGQETSKGRFNAESGDDSDTASDEDMS